jgi:hypothetical protein
LVLSSALALLSDAASCPGSAWRNLTLATTAACGMPQARMVVLRHVDAAKRQIDIHTDLRSAKIEALRHTPAALLHGWDAARRIQLQLSGPITLHANDDIAAGAWQSLREASRATYGRMPGPGTPIGQPGQTTPQSESEAFAIFCVARMQLQTLEWLHLGQGCHRRARFCWHHDICETTWLVP